MTSNQRVSIDVTEFNMLLVHRHFLSSVSTATSIFSRAAAGVRSCLFFNVFENQTELFMPP